MIEIIHMNQDHISTLAELEKICFHTPWTEKQLLEELENKHSLFLVAKKDKNIVGYVGCQTTIDGGYITNVVVSPEMRCQGVAQKLLSELASKIKEKKLDFITLEVRVSNTAAINLYSKMNYKEVGIRKNFYRNPKEDALLMTYKINKNQIQESVK